MVEWDAALHGYGELARIGNAWWPRWQETPEDWAEYDRTRDTDRYRKRYLALAGEDRVIGIGFDSDDGVSPGPGKSEVTAVIELELVGEREHKWLLDEVLRITGERGCTIVNSWERENETTRVSMLKERGFTILMREPISALDLTTWSAEPWTDRIERTEREGYKIVSLAEMFERYNDDWIPAAYELENEIMADVPTHDEFIPSPIEVYERRLKSPVTNRELYLIAIADDRPVALTMLFPNKIDPTYANTGLTGVSRAHRRKGLATALKATALQRAKERGVREIVTDNEESNPMLALNVELGFRADDAWLHLASGR